MGGEKAKIFLSDGELSHAETGELIGLPALVKALAWETGVFKFIPGALRPNGASLALTMQFALMEAARLHDENVRTKQDAMNAFAEATAQSEIPAQKEEGRMEMAQNQRSSTDVLEELLKIPGVDAVVVAGRDGFVIESVGSTARLNIDALGAALAHAVSSVEEMGGELQIDKFQDLFIEYGRALILCRPVGEAIAALVSPDASKLGIVRHKSKILFEELGRFF